MAAAGAGAGPKPPDREYFKEWARTCQVKKVQQQYEALASEAGTAGVAVEALMKQKGFRDHSAFLKSCPQFDLFCWPSELAELGSGFVLYFHFLTFLMAFLLFAFVLQAPAMAYYARADGLNEWANHTTQEMYLTPGNLGREAGDRFLVPVAYFLIAVFLCLTIVAKHTYQLRVDKQVDSDSIQPNDFAVMVEGLPVTATDESQIMSFFEQHAWGRSSKETPTEVVKVVIGWDIVEFREKTKRLKQLNDELRNMDPSQDVQELQKEVVQIRKDLASAADSGSRLKSSGVAVVIFRHQHDQRECVALWDNVWIRHSFGLCGRDGCQDYACPTTGKLHRLRVRRAPNPGDINWEDLGVPFKDRAKRFMKTNTIMSALICVTFWIIFGMQKVKDEIDVPVLSVLPAIVIMLSNLALMVASKKFAEQEYHNTVTEQIASSSIKMAVAMMVSTSGVLLWTRWEDEEWYISTGLVADLTSIVLILGVLRPFGLALIDGCVDIKGRAKRRSCSSLDGWLSSRVNDDKIEQWKGVIQGVVASKGKAQEEQAEAKKLFNDMKREIDFYKTRAEPSPLDVTRRYAYAVNVFICCMLYSPVFPAICFLGIVGLFVQYWADKWVLLRVSRRPTVPLNAAQAKSLLSLVRFVVLIFFPWAFWMFLKPSWRDRALLDNVLFMSLICAYGFCALPLKFWRYVLGVQCLLRGAFGRVADEAAEDDYFKAQHLWPKEFKYHKSHFLYKGLPDSKNPEMLKPGTKSSTGAEDLKGAVGAAADAAGETKPDTMTIGRKKVPTSSPVHGVLASDDAPQATKAEELPVEPSGKELAVETPAAEELAVESVQAEPPASKPAAEPATEPAAGELAASSSGGPPLAPPAAAPPKAVWEFETRSGWERFNSDCHNYIEKKYSEGGATRVKVKTGKITLSVDFDKMTQMVEGGHQVRKIRRREE